MLRAKNGFYAFESALLVRPFRRNVAPLGIEEWNAPDRWRAEFKDQLGGALFFGEDVFGAQFCIRHDKIWTFDPETGTFEVMSSSLSSWADDVMSNYELRTGYPLAHDWQMANGPLPVGARLLPKMPFVCGGKYELGNLYPVGDVNAMLFRASIANQIHDLPDGAEIVVKYHDNSFRNT